MTDKNIIKAMECCNTQNCADCPLYNGNSFSEKCKAICFKEMTSLINRQQAEVERLRKEVNLVSIQFQDLQERYEEEQAEIERLKSMNQSKLDMLHDIRAELETAKAEAIKEFAERLKNDLFYKCGDLNYTETCDTRRLIDNIVKEMVGEDND